MSTLKTIALPVMESFFSIQGEGFHTGKPAYFIRLAGCDVGCHWCDVKESWDENLHPSEKVDELIEKATKEKTAIAIITGGEPTLYDLEMLTTGLQNKQLQTHIETSGAHPLTGSWDWVCLSPKKNKPPLDAYYQAANELKVVIYNKDDFKWAEAHAEKVKTDCRLFLQPEWDRSEMVMPWIVDYVKKNPKWRISLQTHKYLNVR